MAQSGSLAWHTRTHEEIFEDLATSPEGLGHEEAGQRLAQHGKNLLPKKERPGLLTIVLHQFASPLIYVLLAAALISAFLGEISDALFILAILSINAMLGSYQEWKAESNAAALRDMLRVVAKVRRSGGTEYVDAELLVPGDLVILESGNTVPADIRLIHTTSLSIEEAVLTGESMAVEKTSSQLAEQSLPVGDRVNIAHAGTSIAKGRGRGIVVATGSATEIGKIAGSLAGQDETRPPLVRRMESFSQRISIVTVFACIALGIIGYMSGIGLKEIFFFAIAAGVSAIPEGLPIAMTVALSISAMRMAKRNVIVRKLTAVEGLGSCTYIATDKTGTLTLDQQTVKRLLLADGTELSVTGEGYSGHGEILSADGRVIAENSPRLRDLILAASLANEASLLQEGVVWKHSGDPVDLSLLALAYKAGINPHELRDSIRIIREIPFEAERKYSAAYYSSAGRKFLVFKGAVETAAALFGPGDREEALRGASRLAEQGYRVLALAGAETEMTGDELPQLRFYGLTALIDPVRPEARKAVEDCHRAGISVAMVTGDHPATALAIARELDIARKENDVVSGVQLGEAEGIDDNFLALVREKKVFARVSPQQKQKIVEALKQLGHFVAVTGDGVNDAPALRAAHIGVAMGYGTDVAKDTASIIVTDNNFASIAAGVEEGRYAYANLRKIIYMLISTGAAEIALIILSLVFQLPLPFLAVQLLWLNLVTNGIQDVALAFEKGEEEAMQRKPRDPAESVFDGLMIRETLLSAGVMSILCFGLWYHLLNNLALPEAGARNILLLLMVLLQNFHVLNCRSETRSAFSIPVADNPVLIGGLVGAQLVHIVSMQIPFMQELLQTAPVSPEIWLKLVATAAIILLVMEAFKFFRKKRKAAPLEGTALSS